MPVPLAEQMYRYIMGQGGGDTFTGLLDTYTGAAAAYSVRKLSSTYTGDALRVRRSSDDTEQDIGFNASNELDTAALLSFVNADVNQYTSDFSSTENLSEFNGAGAAAQSIGGVDDAYKFTLSGGNVQHTAFTSANTLESGKSFTIVFDYYIPSGQTLSSIVFDNFGGSGAISGSLNVTDNWTTATINFTADGTRPRWWAGAFGANVNGDGDVFYLKNIVVTQTTADGAVTKWYDQSGNGNDAINADASGQPLVVSGGSVVTENDKAAIQFDGVDDKLQKDFIPDIAQALTLLHVRRYRSNGVKCALSYNGSTYADINVSSQFRSNYGSYIGGPSQNTSQGLWYSLANGTSSQIALDGATATSGSAGTNGLEKLTIGSANGSLVTELTTQEIIIFDSDQSSNRTGIETNINDHFDIYTP